jgi:hypothetical protein
MTRGLVEITIRVEMELDDEGYLSSEQEKQLDDICCDIVDLCAKNDFIIDSDEWDILD